MFKPLRLILFILAAALLVPASAAASTTVWTMNSYALPVPHSYKGEDWAGYISFGQSFELLETKGDYAKLRNAKGNTAWVLQEYLVDHDPNTLDQMLVVQCDGDILWPQAGYIEEPIRLKKGDMLHAVCTTPGAEWYRVEYNGSYYYALKKLLNETAAPEQGPIFITYQPLFTDPNVPLYKMPDQTGFLGTLDDGTKVTLLEVNGSMAKTRTGDNLEGYTEMCNILTPEEYKLFAP